MDRQLSIVKPAELQAVPGCCTTERLRLRPLECQDAEAITQLISNWHVIKMLSVPPWPYQRKDADEFLERVGAQPADGPNWTRAIVDLKGDSFMGIVGIERRDTEDRLGYWLGEPFWGRGYMTEAVRAIVTLRFAADPTLQICSSMLKENLASRRVQEKLGFRVVGEGFMKCRPRGSTEPTYETLLVREDFERAIA